MITIMATMSGFIGYIAIGDFAQRYKKELLEYLSVKKGRLASYATVRRVLIGIEHEKFGRIFQKWMISIKVHIHRLNALSNSILSTISKKL